VPHFSALILLQLLKQVEHPLIEYRVDLIGLGKRAGYRFLQRRNIPLFHHLCDSIHMPATRETETGSQQTAVMHRLIAWTKVVDGPDVATGRYWVAPLGAVRPSTPSRMEIER
jgi:hypothetical protein